MGKKEKIAIGLIVLLLIIKLIRMGIAAKVILALAIGYSVWNYWKNK